jgi:hypothetical protein
MAQVSWGVIAALVREGIAALWTRDGRDLVDWEVAALLRTRMKKSGEMDVQDQELVLRSGPEIDDAYIREFGDWLDHDSK